MTIEQKAKAYDEAISLIKDYNRDEEGFICVKPENIFPELKESKDEKIRNQIINFIEEYGNPIHCEWQKDWIAWLEKQGEHVEINPTEFDTRLQALIGKFETLPKEELVGSLSFWLNVVQNDGTYKREEKQGEQKLLNNDKYQTVSVEILDRLYESEKELEQLKQREQKPANNILEAWKDMRLEVYQQASGNRHESNYSDDATKMFSLNDIDEIMEKMSEQNPADKVEPKFHEGEWITNGDYTWKIVEVKPLDYILQSQDGNVVDDTISHVDEQFHSFTIEDAKDGDVLISKYGNIGIFQKNDDFTWTSYFPLGYNGVEHVNEKTYPATKEQRDALMKAITDAGYTFDFEKKELKKIEEKHAENKGMNLVEEEMTPFQKKVFSIIDTAIEEEQGLKQVCDELFTLASNEIKQKPAEWSEEDERKINRVYSILRQAADTHAFSTSCRLIGDKECIELQDFLKSLRPQYHWKPTEKQLYMLNWLATNVLDDGVTGKPAKEVLYSLYEQLKQL